MQQKNRLLIIKGTKKFAISELRLPYTNQYLYVLINKLSAHASIILSNSFSIRKLT